MALLHKLLVIRGLYLLFTFGLMSFCSCCCFHRSWCCLESMITEILLQMMEIIDKYYFFYNSLCWIRAGWYWIVIGWKKGFLIEQKDHRRWIDGRQHEQGLIMFMFSDCLSYDNVTKYLEMVKVFLIMFFFWYLQRIYKICLI